MHLSLSFTSLHLCIFTLFCLCILVLWLTFILSLIQISVNCSSLASHLFSCAFFSDLFICFVIMSAKCTKASLHHDDADSDDDAAHDAAHDHDSSLSLSDAEPHHFSHDLSASSLWTDITVDSDISSDYDDEDIMIALNVLWNLSVFDESFHSDTSVSISTHSLHFWSVHFISSSTDTFFKCSHVTLSVIALAVCLSVMQSCVHCLKDLMSHYSYHSEQCRHSAWDQKCFYCSQQWHVCIQVNVC